MMMIGLDAIESLCLYDIEENAVGSADIVFDDKWDCQFNDGKTFRQAHCPDFASALNALQYWRQTCLDGKGVITALASFQIDPPAGEVRL